MLAFQINVHQYNQFIAFPGDAMTRKKKFLIIIAAVVLLLAAGLAFLWTNLDWIVKNAIERYGSQATGTAVRVDRVNLNPAQGKGMNRRT